MAKESSHRTHKPAYYRLTEKVAMSRLGTWMILNISSRLDPRLMAWTNGRFSFASLIGLPLVLLTTIGAKSGKERVTPLVYVQDGEGIVLIASQGGRPQHPGWYYNLRANPQATLTFKGRTAIYTAREATGPERETLWLKAVDMYAGYAEYQERAGERLIPVMVLTPRDF